MKTISIDKIISCCTSNGYIGSTKSKSYSKITQYTTDYRGLPAISSSRFPFSVVRVLLDKQVYLLYSDGYVRSSIHGITSCVKTNKIYYQEHFSKIPGYEIH